MAAIAADVPPESGEPPSAAPPKLHDYDRTVTCRARVAAWYTRVAFLRYLVLHVVSGLAQILAGIVTIILSPWRPFWIYAVFGVLCVVKIMFAIMTSLDMLVNLVEERPDAQRIMSAITGDSRLGRYFQRFAQGRGSYVPMSDSEMLSNFFFGFPTGTFMVSYSWEHPELPRRMARSLLPEVAPRQPNKCWLDVEQLIPGTIITQACAAAVTAARFVFVFREQAYMQSKNCMTELRALLAKPDGKRRAIVFEYSDLPSPDVVPVDAPPSVVPLDEHERRKLEQLPVVRRVSTHREQQYETADLLGDLVSSGALRELLRERSPRINATCASRKERASNSPDGGGCRAMYICAPCSTSLAFESH